MGRAVAVLTAIGAMLLIAGGCGGKQHFDTFGIKPPITVSDPTPEYGDDVVFVIQWDPAVGKVTLYLDFGGMAPNIGPVMASTPYETTVTVNDLGEDKPRNFTCTATLTGSKGRTASVSTMITAVPAGYGD